MATDDKEVKKRDSANKVAFDLHVGALMRLDGISKPVAMARAYAAGPGELNQLIGRPTPPASVAKA